MKDATQLHLIRQLHSLLKSGLSLLDAVQMMGLNTIQKSLATGNSLSYSLSKMGFHPFCVSLIQTGEATGNLLDSLSQASIYLEKQIKLQKKIKKALSYPCIVLFVSSLVLLAMFHWVIPSFENMFANFQADLPWPTRLLIQGSHWVQNYSLIVVIALGSLMGLFHLIWRRHTQTQQMVDHLLLTLPIIGSIRRSSLLIQWSRNISLLTSRGVPILEALKQTALHSNDWVSFNFCAQINISLAQGWSLSESIKQISGKSLLSQKEQLQLIKVGEVSGDLPQMLANIANQEEDHLDHMIDQLAQSIEPCLMIIMGLIIACLVISLYLPIFEMGQIL
jgi:type IV pilus assembly protein PilC